MFFNMLEAKTQLSKLVDAAMRGEEVVIANRGKPMVRLVKAEPAAASRAWGAWAGQMSDAEVDHAFTPQSDAAITQAFMRNAASRALRVAEPAAPYTVKRKAKAKAAPSRKR
jgi:prevent-host-death family protein